MTISEDFLAAHGDVLRHLYVEDGDRHGRGQGRRADCRLGRRGRHGEEIAASAQELAHTAEQLERLVARFRLTA